MFELFSSEKEARNFLISIPFACNIKGKYVFHATIPGIISNYSFIVDWRYDKVIGVWSSHTWEEQSLSEIWDDLYPEQKKYLIYHLDKF